MLLVECGRGYSEELGRYDTFDCSYENWLFLLALGVKYGWQPQQDYQPFDWLYCTTVSFEEACNFRNALLLVLNDVQNGKTPTVTDDMIPISEESKVQFFVYNYELEKINLDDHPFKQNKIKELIDFLERGKFDFAFDD